MSFRRAAGVDDLWAGEMSGLVVAAKRVLLLNVGGQICAYEDRCAHQGVALSQGRLAGRTVTCFAHGWQYDACSGSGLRPSGVNLRSYPVRIEADQILIDVGGELAGDGDPQGRSVGLGTTPSAGAATGSGGTDPRDRVGPVLQAGPLAEAVIAAIRQANPDLEVIDRGSYLRVLCAGTCAVSRAAIEAAAGRSFRLPVDLEAIMPSFKGRLWMSDDAVRWELGAPPRRGDLP